MEVFYSVALFLLFMWFISHVDTLYQQCLYFQNILAHNFLDMQQIYNSFKVLESLRISAFQPYQQCWHA